LLAQHSCVLVQVAMPHATGAAVGVTGPASALPVVPPLPVVPVPVPVVPPEPPPVVLPPVLPDVPDVPPDVAVPPEVPVPVALAPPSNEPSSRMPPPQAASGATRTPNEKEAMPNSDGKRAHTFMCAIVAVAGNKDHRPMTIS
jgi:hypothetical protein